MLKQLSFAYAVLLSVQVFAQTTWDEKISLYANYGKSKMSCGSRFYMGDTPLVFRYFDPYDYQRMRYLPQISELDDIPFESTIADVGGFGADFSYVHESGFTYFYGLQFQLLNYSVHKTYLSETTQSEPQSVSTSFSIAGNEVTTLYLFGVGFSTNSWNIGFCIGPKLGWLKRNSDISLTISNPNNNYFQTFDADNNNKAKTDFNLAASIFLNLEINEHIIIGIKYLNYGTTLYRGHTEFGITPIAYGFVWQQLMLTAGYAFEP